MPKKNPTELDKKKAVFRVSEHRRKLKILALDYLGGKCQRCGYDKSPAALHFHHKDPTKKEFSISESGNTRSFDSIKIELDQCIILCANCHAEEHWIESQASRDIQIEFFKENSIPKAQPIIKNCSMCQTEITVSPSRITENNYCSPECRIQHRRILSDYGWLSDDEMLKLKETLTYTEIAVKLNKEIKLVYYRFDTIRMRKKRNSSRKV